MKAVPFLAGACLLIALPAWAIDAFDRPTLRTLQQAAKGAEPLEGLSSGEAAELEVLGGGVTSPCVVIKTDQGNWAKALVGWGLRKGEGKPVPVLMVERYVTYDAGRPGQTVAAGKDVMLFAGFGFNFDIGQVVPAKQGADVEFTAERRLVAAGEAELFGLDGKLLTAKEPQAPVNPNDHQGVLPRDFSGVWKLNADGRWQGTLELIVDDDGNVDGQYLSSETQSTYPIAGKVDNPSHRMILEIELVNSAQAFEAFLWTTDKSTMAGTTTMADRKFGFYAVRSDDAKPDRNAKAPGARKEPMDDEQEPMSEEESDESADGDEPAADSAEDDSDKEPCSCEAPAEHDDGQAEDGADAPEAPEETDSEAAEAEGEHEADAAEGSEGEGSEPAEEAQAEGKEEVTDDADMSEDSESPAPDDAAE